MTNIESLHTHTTLSDGKLSHKEMFDLAESLGVSVIAFTDHDAVPPPEILAELETLRDRKTKWIIGSEITAGLPKELTHLGNTSMHIIGLFLDPTNAALIEHCRRAQEARIKRMNHIVGSLQHLGFKITAEDCLEMSGGESVGRPHIVLALQKYPENNILQEKIRLEMATEAEHNPEIQEQYTNMIQKGEKQYPYTLFLMPTAYRNCYVEAEYMPDLDEAVKLIRDAGGVAVLAHYFSIKSKISMEFLEKLIAEKRFDGLEVVYGLREYGTNEEIEMTRERRAVHEIIKKYGAIAAGGSDAHTIEDLEKYVANDWFSGETAGFASNILASGRVNKQFSSL